MKTDQLTNLFDPNNSLEILIISSGDKYTVTSTCDLWPLPFLPFNHHANFHGCRSNSLDITLKQMVYGPTDHPADQCTDHGLTNAKQFTSTSLRGIIKELLYNLKNPLRYWNKTISLEIAVLLLYKHITWHIDWLCEQLITITVCCYIISCMYFDLFSDQQDVH